MARYRLAFASPVPNASRAHQKQALRRHNSWPPPHQPFLAIRGEGDESVRHEPSGGGCVVGQCVGLVGSCGGSLSWGVTVHGCGVVVLDCLVQVAQKGSGFYSQFVVQYLAGFVVLLYCLGGSAV